MMKIGLQIPNFTWPGGPAEIADRLKEIAILAEASGFSSLWVMDHFFQIGDKSRTSGLGPAEDEMLEGYGALHFLAAHTRKVKLGTLVTGVVYRHPGILVKTVTTLDVLSGGRAYLGIGAAWNQREAQGLGIPFPPVAERFQRLEEALQIARQMWSGEVTPFNGRFYQLAEPLCIPRPLSRPHPPILIGGGGEKKTLRLVARYADACNLFARLGLDVVGEKLDVLKRHCDEVGRDYTEIEKTTLNTVRLAPGAAGAPSVVAELKAQCRLGIRHAIFNMPNVHELTPLEIFGREIIPEAAGF